MNRQVFRAFRNPAFIGGLVLLALGTGPLVVDGLLQDWGLIRKSTGLGFGLLFFITIWPAAALIIGGFAVAVRRVDGAKDKGAA